MRIVFLCGSLEPGRDGVGDYVRRLAAELLRQGHEATCLALNDPHCGPEEVLATQPLGAEAVPVLRLPAGWPARRRFRRARQWVEAFNPAWVSLQFVPYAFDAKGLPLLLGRQLRGLTTGRRVQVMMHESWAGAGAGTGLKRRLVAALQKAVIARLLRGLRPAVVHTHLPVYRIRLQRLGWPVRPLPLFSNIPVGPPPAAPAPAVFQVGVFSQADDSAPFVDFLVRLAAHVLQRKQRFQVLLMGGEPTKMQTLAATLEQQAGLRNAVRYAGFLAPEQLSEALHGCCLGLTPVPRHSLGKSGSVAAFLAHGIPVAAPYVHPESVADDIGFFTADLRAAILLQPDTLGLPAAAAAARAARPGIQAAAVAQRFLADLTGQMA